MSDDVVTMQDGREYSDATKQLAYEVYCYLADQSGRRAARILADEHGLDVDARTIQRWAKQEAWTLRHEAEMVALAPAMFHRAISTLVLGAPAAASTLRRFADADAPDHLDFVKAYGSEGKNVLAAASSLLERIGIGTLGRTSRPEFFGGMDAEALPDVATLGAEALRQREADILDRIKGETAKRRQERTTGR